MHWQDSEDGDGSMTWMMDTMGVGKRWPAYLSSAHSSLIQLHQLRLVYHQMLTMS
jgi:hypothetical protein